MLRIKQPKKVLFCGDLHTKISILNQIQALDEQEHYDQIVFLGDYVDEWHSMPQDSYNILKALIDWKKLNPLKIILLLGNHDFSEWMPSDFECSGYNPITHMIVKNLFDDNENLFRVAHEVRGFLCSHAGLTNGWVKDLSLMESCFAGTKAEECDANLAVFFKGRNQYEKSHQVFMALGTAGPARGGWHNPSPIWADYTELIKDPLSKTDQIVGHTPVRKLTKHIFNNGDGRKNTLYFCDTHSLYPNGENYGDNTLLELNWADENLTTSPTEKVYSLKDEKYLENYFD